MASHFDTTTYKERGDALKEEYTAAIAVIRARHADELAAFEAEWNLKWRELQQAVGFRK